jgi:hypothetical protein
MNTGNAYTIISPGSTAYVAYEAKIAADSARALGNSADAAHFDQVFNAVKADFNAKWWDASVGFYRESNTKVLQQSFQAIALEFGLVPDAQRRGLQEKLINDIMVTRAGHEEVGIVGSRWIFPALTHAAFEGVPGAAEAAYTIATQTTYPSYGYWANTLGWTSLGEFWEASSRTRTHHMFGAIAQWFYEGLAGLQPSAPGYKTIAFKPLIAPGIPSASASYDSVRGKVASAWSQDENGVTLTVTVPPNSTGTVYVPGTDPANIAETATGRPLRADHAPGVSYAGTADGRTAYSVQSGTYRFQTGLAVVEPGSPAPQPSPGGGRDTTKPRIWLLSPKRQNIRGLRTRGLRFRLAVDEAAALRVTLDGRFTSRRHARGKLQRMVRTRPLHVKAGRTTLTLKLSTAMARRVRAEKRLPALLMVRATDAAGNYATRTKVLLFR